jgi:antitoxin (DNA-binding transcriptional repressor) of toxin-antitoxin stability system
MAHDEGKSEWQRLLPLSSAAPAHACHCEAGEELVIARDGRPVARKVGAAAAAPRRYGVGEGKVWIAEDFDAPMPDVEGALDEPLRLSRMSLRLRPIQSPPRRGT